MQSAQGIERLVFWILSASALCLMAGLYLPIIYVSNLIIFTDRISVLSGIADLISDKEFFLALIVIVFSILFPVSKIVIADYVWRISNSTDRRNKTALNLLSAVGRWSMLDILVVALILFSLKASMLGDAKTQPGIYFFAASILLSSIGVAVIKRAEARINDQAVRVEKES
tara:strand:+ start:13296 stop:13808 length:513 start_codon:yes stop_codon:yes gene_type:complete